MEAHSAEGPIPPGEYLLMVVLAVYEVKVDATGGEIRAGDPLAVSATQGLAVRARTVTVEGVSFYPPGVAIGTALASLEAAQGAAQGTGTIPVYVRLR